jgi:hypothetical protein
MKFLKNIFPLKAKVSANVQVDLHGTERLLSVFGLIALLIIITSLILLAFMPNIWAIIGLFFGICLLIVLLFIWLRKSPGDYEGSPILISASDDRVILQTRTYDPGQKITLLREIIQNRNPLPHPKGEVVGNNPTDEQNLREYADDESAEDAQALSDKINQHDIQILNELQMIEAEYNEAVNDELNQIPGKQTIDVDTPSDT